MSAPAIIRWDQAYNRNGDRALPREVVNAIRTYMNNHTLEGWVKGETLAEATGLKIRQVRRQIADNVEAGWLEILKSGNSSGLANRYRLAYPKGVIEDTLASDPWGSGIHPSPVDITTESKGVVDDTLGLIAEYKRSQPYLDTGHSVILWPSDKPLPDDYYPQDPFRSSTYICDETGAVLTG